MPNTEIFFILLVSTGKWDLEKNMGWEMGLVPPPLLQDTPINSRRVTVNGFNKHF